MRGVAELPWGSACAESTRHREQRRLLESFRNPPRIFCGCSCNRRVEYNRNKSYETCPRSVVFLTQLKPSSCLFQLFHLFYHCHRLVTLVKVVVFKIAKYAAFTWFVFCVWQLIVSPQRFEAGHCCIVPLLAFSWCREFSSNIITRTHSRLSTSRLTKDRSMAVIYFWRGWVSEVAGGANQGLWVLFSAVKYAIAQVQHILPVLCPVPPEYARGHYHHHTKLWLLVYCSTKLVP